MLHHCLQDYVGDIAVKFREVHHHTDDLRKIFTKCMQYNLRMNPMKWAFGVSLEELLGFTVHKK